MSESNTTSQQAIDEQRRLLEKRLPVDFKEVRCLGDMELLSVAPREIRLRTHIADDALNPRGFAHGFQVLSEQAVFAYKCGDVYHPEDEGGLRYDDADIGIVWPGQDTPILSEKDQNWPALRALGIEL